MARPTWTGSISFGLVNVPIRIFAATESHRVAFHEVERGTGERIRYRRVAEGSGREVPWKEVQKGFEVGKDQLVVLTDDELEAAEPARTHTIDIHQFVPLGEIDPVAWDQSYYVAPDGASAAKAYVLLRDAMRKDGRVAIGQFVMRTKEYVACLRPLEHALALHTMFFADEVRHVKDVVELPKHATVTANELALATRLIESLAAHWDPSELVDTFRKKVLALVKKKERNETIEAPVERAKSPRIVDLMSALKATLAEAPKQGPSPRRRAAPSPSRTRGRLTRDGSQVARSHRRAR